MMLKLIATLDWVEISRFLKGVTLDRDPPRQLQVLIGDGDCPDRPPFLACTPHSHSRSQRLVACDWSREAGVNIPCFSYTLNDIAVLNADQRHVALAKLNEVRRVVSNVVYSATKE